MTSPWAGYRWGPVSRCPAGRCTVLPAAAAVRLARARRRSRSAWSARTGRGGRATARSSLASGRSTPATGCAGSTGGSRCAPASCTWSAPAPRRTRAVLLWSTRWPTRRSRRRRRGGEQPRRDGAGRRRARRALPPCAATGSGCGSSGRRRRRSATAPDARTCGGSWHSLARIRPGRSDDATPGRFRLRATAGTVVLVLTPMLSELIATVDRALARRGLPRDRRRHAPRRTPRTAGRRHRRGRSPAWPGGCGWSSATWSSASLARAGCPVVPWRGPGTLDEVLRRLARRAQLPRVVRGDRPAPRRRTTGAADRGPVAVGGAPGGAARAVRGGARRGDGRCRGAALGPARGAAHGRRVRAAARTPTPWARPCSCCSSSGGGRVRRVRRAGRCWPPAGCSRSTSPAPGRLRPGGHRPRRRAGPAVAPAGRAAVAGGPPRLGRSPGGRRERHRHGPRAGAGWRWSAGGGGRATAAPGRPGGA